MIILGRTGYSVTASTSSSCPVRNLSGCRIMVVCMLWEHMAWVQFPAPRKLISNGVGNPEGKQNFLRGKI